MFLPIVPATWNTKPLINGKESIMKELYTAPSVTVYTMVPRNDLANSFHFNQLLGQQGNPDAFTSDASSDIEYPPRTY